MKYPLHRIFNPIGAVPPPETNYTRINQVELAVARDLKGPWHRVADRSLFLEVEPWTGENWGCSQILVAGAVVREDKGEVWTYYNALRNPGKIADYKRFNRTSELHRLSVDPNAFERAGGALSLAKLPLDRFVSIDAEMAGQLLTKPFEWKGEDLYINADSKWGEICKCHFTMHTVCVVSSTSPLSNYLGHVQTWRSLMRTPADRFPDFGFQQRHRPHMSATRSAPKFSGRWNMT
jgi:hypothetical protein